MAKKRLDLNELQRRANEYAREAFTVTNMYLDGMSDERFEQTAGAIVAALVMAWAAGFVAGHHES